jgi:5-methylcytosine-specific restriction protein A
LPSKSCQYCGIVPLNHKCPVKAKEKRREDLKREDKKIYWSSKWRRLRDEVLEDCNNICLFSMYVEGIIKPADCVHHIVEIEKDVSKGYDNDNLIALNKDVHEYIHKVYKTEYKSECIELLIKCKQDWDNGVRMEGLGRYKDIVSKWEVE